MFLVHHACSLTYSFMHHMHVVVAKLAHTSSNKIGGDHMCGCAEVEDVRGVKGCGYVCANDVFRLHVFATIMICAQSEL